MLSYCFPFRPLLISLPLFSTSPSFLQVSFSHSWLLFYLVTYWVYPGPSVWPWAWNRPLEPVGLISRYATEDSNFSSLRIHRQPLVQSGVIGSYISEFSVAVLNTMIKNTLEKKNSFWPWFQVNRCLKWCERYGSRSRKWNQVFRHTKLWEIFYPNHHRPHDPFPCLWFSVDC